MCLLGPCSQSFKLPYAEIEFQYFIRFDRDHSQSPAHAYFRQLKLPILACRRNICFLWNIHIVQPIFRAGIHTTK